MTSQYNGEHNNNQNEQKSFNQKHITDQVRVTTLLLIHYLVLTRLNNDSVNTKHKQTKWAFVDSLSWMLNELISQWIQKPPKSWQLPKEKNTLRATCLQIFIVMNISKGVKILTFLAISFLARTLHFFLWLEILSHGDYLIVIFWFNIFSCVCVFVV